jgi:GNAT superfamily N-acetyltransferase
MEAEAVQALGSFVETLHYLAGVGVDPNNQGRGYGSALIKRVVENAAHAGVSCALVTDRERNLPLYERCGFRTVASRTVTADVRFWSMIANSTARTQTGR